MLKMKGPGQMSYLALLNCNKKNHNRKKITKKNFRLETRASLSSFTRNNLTQWARWAATTYPDQPGFNLFLFLPQVFPSKCLAISSTL